MIFGHLLTSGNYDDSIKKTTGGRNGYGAKLANIFSTEFTLETADGKRNRRYKQAVESCAKESKDRDIQHKRWRLRRTTERGMSNSEGSSMTTPVASSNIGFQLLKKQGWKEGTGLGISEQGRLEPVQAFLKKNKRGWEQQR